MKNKYLILLVVAVIVIGIGFYIYKANSSRTPPRGALQEGSVAREAQEKTQTQESQSNSTEGKMVSGYTGKVLAGTTAPFIIFNLPDYEKALKDNKIIVLDFFANWCPECREEAPKLHAGFDSLSTDKVIGFRVNYNDTDTDKDEKDLAGKYGITFQHTKVILKNGKEFSKDVNLWDKDIFLKEVNKALGS